MKSVAAQIFVLQWAIVVLLVATGDTLLVLQARHADVQGARDRSLAVASGFAKAPGTAAALRTSHPTAVLEPQALSAQRIAGVDFLTVLDRDGVRVTDPRRNLIGTHAAGDLRRGLSGQSYTEHFQGPPSNAVRAVVPVVAPDGTVVGLVTAGLETTTVAGAFNRGLPVLIAGAVGALALATLGAALVSRRLSRQTHGLGPAEVTRMYEHHAAVLHSVREGVLVFDGDRRLVLANDEGRRLLDLPPDVESRPVRDLGLPPETEGLLAGGRETSDQVVRVGDRMLAVNVRPTGRDGGPPGSVATLRDTTELRALTGRAEAARRRLELLYDAGVRIGSTLDVVRTTEELADLAVPRFADAVTVDLREAVLSGQEPQADPRPAMRRVTARDAVAGHDPEPVGGVVAHPPGTPQARALAEGHAVLATGDGEPGGSLICVPLRARGVVLGLTTFLRRRQSPFTDEDLSPAEELAARAAVCVDNARRYTREHTMAVLLQRSLLPHGLPEQHALDVAHHYVPARTGAGGDWFDVIALPGERVALVVGDVVGHGVHAVATMGRLRTAARNFCALDLPPDDLLAHLDDLVTAIDQENTLAGGQEETISGATVLYAVYDPVTGGCALAGAGHPPPALVAPDGTVSLLDVPANPPLGLGAATVEMCELTLEEGSRLVLYTDGLLRGDGRDTGRGLELLCATLGRAGPGCAATRDAVSAAMIPASPRDDAVLLVAGTRRLGADRVAQWEVPQDPAAVAPARAACMRQLAAWGLDDAAFAAELILSELITNAVRYGQPPITVRLLRDRTLTCEVSDGAGTSPRVRRASALDEGGRGLFLVAQFAQRWGVRYTTNGKVVWSEQPLG
ncbi:histidine kinase [Streptomyces sp. ICBB 8177]|nr:histidine kinase [Streptomyces sp. ICBB 8177]